MNTPTLEPRGPKKQIGIQTDTVEHAEMQAEAEDTGLNVSELYHIDVEIKKMLVEASKALGVVRPTAVSDTELYLLLVAKAGGLLNEDELNHLLWSAEHETSGASLKQRLPRLLALFARRLAGYDGAERPFVQVPNDHPQIVQAAIEAEALKQAMSSGPQAITGGGSESETDA